MFQMVVYQPKRPPQNLIFETLTAVKFAIVGMAEKFDFEIDESTSALLENIERDADYVFSYEYSDIKITVASLDTMASIIDQVVEAEAPADPLIAYVLMRTDVPDYFGPKAQAQSNHAGTKMIFDALSSGNMELLAELTEWEQEAGGFGTCIVLHATAQQMRQAVSLAELLGVHAGIVHDPTFPVRDGDRYTTLPIDTCAYVFGRKSKCRPVVGALDLLRQA